MTGFKPGEIVLIPFPFTDFSTLKQRPAVVLSSAAFNRTHQDVIVAAITSHLPENPAAEDFVLAAEDLKSAGLPKASLIKLGKIVTIDRRLIRKRLGVLPETTLGRVHSQFQKVFVTA